MGRKFIKSLATAAMLDPNACQLFIHLMDQLESQYWPWYHIGILCLGVGVLSAANSSVRKMALCQGLLKYIDKDTRPGTENDQSWKIRSASVMALAEVYQQNKADTLGLLAYEAIRERKKAEQHPEVISKMNYSSSCSGNSPRRLSFLFKYICIALAENYSESQSRYVFLRKYLRTTDRKSTSTSRHQKLGTDNQIKTLDIQKTPVAKIRPHSRSKVKRFWENDKMGDAWDPFGTFSLKNDYNTHEIEDELQLCTDPYHFNYKKYDDKHTVGELVTESSVDPQNADSKTQLPNRPSLLATHPYSTAAKPAPCFDVAKPAHGTVSRRKLCM